MPLDPERLRARHLGEAQGYLFLGMPERALESLDAAGSAGSVSFEESFLRGMALRELGRHSEALEAFGPAFTESPDSVPLLVAMAWCYKRVGQVPKSVEMLDLAYKVEPDNALILYNLSCYWALLHNKAKSLSWLGRALRMDGSYRKQIPTEPDFDSLREDPDFQFIAGLPGGSERAPSV